MHIDETVIVVELPQSSTCNTFLRCYKSAGSEKSSTHCAELVRLQGLGWERGEGGGERQNHSEEEKPRESGIACSHNRTLSFLHLSFWYSLSVMRSLVPSLPPLIHLLPALPDSLFGPHSPVIHSTCQSWQWHQSHADSRLELGGQDLYGVRASAESLWVQFPRWSHRRLHSENVRGAVSMEQCSFSVTCFSRY